MTTRPIILLGGMNGGANHPNGCLSPRSVGIVPNVPPSNLSYSEFLSSQLTATHVLGEQTCIELAFEHILNNVSVEFESNGLGQNPKGGKDILGVLVDDWPNTALANLG